MKLLNVGLGILLLQSAFVAPASAQEGRLFVDNHGKVWRIVRKPCLNGTATCVEGQRDLQNTLKCEELPVRGVEVASSRGKVLSATVFPNAGKCIATSWSLSYDSISQIYRGFATTAEGKEFEVSIGHYHENSLTQPRVTREDPSMPEGNDGRSTGGTTGRRF